MNNNRFPKPFVSLKKKVLEDGLEIQARFGWFLGTIMNLCFNHLM